MLRGGLAGLNLTVERMASTHTIRPPRPAPGARVGLVAPSGVVLERDDCDRSAELVRALGLEPVVFPNAGNRFGYFAGTDAERLADLQSALDDPNLSAVWAVRGGFGVTRILGSLSFAGLSRHPKVLLGFSDLTALLLAAHAATRLITLHGPVARNGLTRFSRDSLERVLFDPAPAGLLPMPAATPGVTLPRSPRVVTLVPGVAVGPVVGGNLTLMQCLIGTGALPRLDGAILFLEDVNEHLYRIDRTLAHLRDAGLLDGLAGVAIGQFTDLKVSTGDGARGLDEVLHDYLDPLGIPAARGFPIGHVDDQWTVPVGARASLDAGAGTLTLLEGAVG